MRRHSHECERRKQSSKTRARHGKAAAQDFTETPWPLNLPLRPFLCLQTHQSSSASSASSRPSTGSEPPLHLTGNGREEAAACWEHPWDQRNHGVSYSRATASKNAPDKPDIEPQQPALLHQPNTETKSPLRCRSWSRSWTWHGPNKAEQSHADTTTRYQKASYCNSKNASAHPRPCPKWKRER